MHAADALSYYDLPTPTAGLLVRPDGWSCVGYSELRKAPDGDLAPFRLPSVRYSDVAYPVIVTVTGRTIQSRGGRSWVRCSIEWVHDGEPNTHSGGWLSTTGF